MRVKFTYNRGYLVSQSWSSSRVSERQRNKRPQESIPFGDPAACWLFGEKTTVVKTVQTYGTANPLINSRVTRAYILRS